MRYLPLFAATLALGGCQAVRDAKTVPEKVAVIQTTADKAVGDAAEALKAACFAAKIGIDLTATFTKNQKLINALGKARIATVSYCDGPTPRDIPGALAAVTAAYRAIIDSSPEIRAMIEENHM